MRLDRQEGMSYKKFMKQLNLQSFKTISTVTKCIKVQYLWQSMASYSMHMIQNFTNLQCYNVFLVHVKVFTSQQMLML